MKGYNYAVSITAESGETYYAALAPYVASSVEYVPTLSSFPSITNAVPIVGATGSGSGSANDEVSFTLSNAGAEYSAWIKARSDSAFVDIIGASVVCSEIDDVGSALQVFSGKVDSLDVSYDGGVVYLSIKASTDGSKTLSEMLPSGIAIPLNLLANGDFASDVEGWEFYSDTAGALSHRTGGGADSQNGYASAVSGAGSPTYIGMSTEQPLAIVAGDKVGFTAYIRTNSGSGRTGNIRFKDDSGAVLETVSVGLTNGVWSGVGSFFIAVADYDLITVEVYVTGCAAAEEVLFDHVRVTSIDVFPLDDALTYEGGFGRPIPFLFGAHRGHYSCVPTIRDPDNDHFCHLVCADVNDALCRVTVNAAYSSDDGHLRVIDASKYVVDRDTYAGRFLLRFSTNRYPEVYVDSEATEFDTYRTGVKRHWRFRDGSLFDEIAEGELVQESTAVADWKFSGNLNDSSGNGYTLAAVAGLAPDYESSTNIDQNALGEGMDSGKVPVKLTLATPDTTFLDFSGSEDFYVEVRIRRDRVFGNIDGWIVSKFGGLPTSRGWGIRFSSSIPVFFLSVQGASTLSRLNIRGKKALNDGQWHTVVGSVSRDAATASLWVDGVLQDEQAIPSGTAPVGSLESTSEGVNVAILGLLWNHVGFQATCALDRVRVFAIPYGADASERKLGVGQSGVYQSAVGLASVTPSSLIEAAPTGVDVAAAQDVVMIAWIKSIDTPGSETVILSRRSTTSYGYALSLVSGAPKFKVGDGTDTVSLTHGSSVCDGDWHCVVGVLSRSDIMAHLYVDGVLSASGDSSALAGLGTSGDFESEGYCSAGGNCIYLDELVVLIGSEVALSAAEVRTHYMTATGNPARIVRKLLTNRSVGLKQSVDSTSFNAAEDEFSAAGIRFGGCLTVQSSAEDIFGLMCSVYGAYVKMSGADVWSMGFGWQSAASATHSLGFNDEQANIAFVRSVTREPIASIPKTLTCKFRPVVDPSSPNGYRLALKTTERLVATAAKERLVVELPYVRDPLCADRIAHFLSEWYKADRSVSVGVDDSVRTIAAGDAATVSITDLSMVAAAMRVVSVSRDGDSISCELRDDSTAAFSYSQGGTPVIVDPETEPDYSSTPPPEPTGLYLIENRGTPFGAIVRVGWQLPTGNLAEALVDVVRVYWMVPSEKGRENWISNDSFRRNITGWSSVSDGGGHTVTLSHQTGKGNRNQKGYLKALHSHASAAPTKVGASVAAAATYAADETYIAKAFIQSDTGSGRTGTIRIKDGATVLATGTVTMTSSDTWYEVTCRATIGTPASTLTVEVYVSAGGVLGEAVFIDDVNLSKYVDDSFFDGASFDLPADSTSAYLSNSLAGIEPGRTAWIWVKTVSRFGVESDAASLLDGQNQADAPFTVLEVDVETETTPGVPANNPQAGNWGHEQRIADLEGCVGPGSTRVVFLDNSGFDGSTTTFNNLLPYEPSLDDSHEVVLLSRLQGVLHRTGTGAGTFGLGGAGGRNVTFGVAPVGGVTPDTVIAIFVQKSAAY